MGVKVTIGVCVKNSEKTIKAVLESIAKQDLQYNSMKLIVVDDGSTDKTLSLAKEFVSKIDFENMICSSKGKGLGFSRQIVVENAKGDYVVWIDGDMIPKKGFIRKHVEFMEKNPGIGAALSKTIFNGKTVISLLDAFNAIREKSRDLNAIGTGGSIFRLKAIERVGGFDVNIKGAGEDRDLSYRLRMSGWKLSINDSAETYHESKQSWRSLWNRFFWYGYGGHFLFHKYKGKMPPWNNWLPFTIWIGFRKSINVYKITNARMQKRMFLLPQIYYSFRSIPHFFGFIASHLDGYGNAQHIQKENEALWRHLI